MDGVLADWIAGVVATAAAIAVRDGYRCDVPRPDQFRQFSVTRSFAGEQLDLILAAMTDPGLYARLPVQPGAADALRGMRAAGLDVFLCTSPDLDNPSCASDKLAWAETHLGREFASQTIITKDKTAVRGDLLIDDKPSVTGLFAPLWQHVVFDHRYNRHVPGLRIRGWGSWRDVILPAVAA